MGFRQNSQRWGRQPPVQLDRQHPLLRDLLQGVVAGPLRDATDAYRFTSCTAVRAASVLGDVIEYTGSGGRATAPTIADSSPWTMVSYGVRRSSAGFSSVATVAESPGNATVDRSIGVNAVGTVQAALYDGSNRIVTTTATIPVDEPRLVAAVATGSAVRAYAGGELASTTATNSGYTAYSTPELVLGYGQMTNSTAASFWSAAYTLLIRRALSLDELMAWEREPWAIFAPRRIFVPTASAGGPSIAVGAPANSTRLLRSHLIGGITA